MNWKRDTMVRWLWVFILNTLLLIPLSLLRAGEKGKPLSLPESISIAIEKSTSIRSADYAIQGAEYERKSARTDFLPKISTQYAYTRYNEDPHMKSPAGEFLPYPVDMKIGRQDRYQWNTYLKQPIFTGGALTSSYQIAKLGVGIAKENLTRTMQDIVVQVKEAYFGILKAEKIKQVALKSEEQVKSHVEVAQAFYEEGMIPHNDLLEAEVRYAQVKQNLIRADNGVQIAKAYFNTVLRQNINEPVEVEDILEYQPETFSLEACQNEALQKRPEIKEASLNLERAQKSVSLAKSSIFPTLSLVINYQKMGDHADLRGNPYEDSESWTVSPVLTWDVWEWGKRYYQISASRARMAQSEEYRKQVQDTVSLEVKEAYLNFMEAEKNIFVAKTAIEQAEENFRLNKERYSEQMATTTDVLDAQTLLTEAKNNYYNALSDYQIAKARLERAIGKE
jgi:outer membrane protein TolC